MTHTDTWDALVAVIREMFGDDTLAIDGDTKAAMMREFDDAHLQLQEAQQNDDEAECVNENETPGEGVY